MKHGLSLTELATEIERRRDAKKDFLVARKALHIDVDPVGGIALEIGDQERLGINDVAHAQFASVLNIPKPYYDRCREQAPDLLAENVNEWLGREPEKVQLVRTLDHKTRALVSDKFRTDLEYEDVAEAALPVLFDLNVDIHSCALTDTKLYIKAVDPSVTRELAKVGGAFGDGQHHIVRVQAPALTLSDSEVGHGAFALQAGVYDQWCSNLATFSESSVRKYHVGARHDLAGEQYAHLLSDRTKAVTNNALIRQIRDVVKGAFDEARFNALVDKIEGTVDDKIEGDPVKAVELGSKKLGLTQDEGKSVLRHLIEGGSLTRFGLYNAVTRASADIESYDRATELEAVGAKVIDLSPKEWNEVAIAA